MDTNPELFAKKLLALHYCSRRMDRKENAFETGILRVEKPKK